MAKLSRVSLERKKELNAPDEFITISNRALEYAMNRKKELAGIVFGLLAVAVIGIGFQYYVRGKEAKASFLLHKANVQFDAVAGSKGPKEALASTKDQFETLAQKYAGTVAGKSAILKFAGIYYQAAEYDQAIAMYQKVLGGNIPSQSPMADMALIGLAYAYESNGALSQAIETYQKVLAQDQSAYKADALFHLGMIYQDQGNPEKSTAAFQKIVSDYEDSPFAEIAKSRVAG